MIAVLDKVFPYRTRDGSVLVLLFTLFFVRLAISAVFPVTVDEAYAVAVSRVPALSYFDHPPLAFGFARLAAWAASSEALMIVRLPHVLIGTLTGWYLYRIADRLYGPSAARLCLAWYCVAPFFFISAGMFVVPDGPLNLFLVLTFWILLPVFQSDKPLHTGQWCLAGLTMALALMCKYQAVLFGLSVFIALIVTPIGRKTFAQRGPWLALIIAVCGLAPMLVWNAQHEWVSFRFQAGRAGDTLSMHLSNFSVMQLGQMAYVLPGTWAVMVWTIYRSLIKPSHQPDFALALVAFIPLVVFDLIALFSENNLPHWPMSGLLFAFPLVGRYFAAQNETYQRWLHRIFRGLIVALPILAILVAAQTHTAFLTRIFFVSAPRGDLDWQLVSWGALQSDFSTRGVLTDTSSFIIPTNWIVGGRAAYALGAEIPVAAPLADPRHFAYSDEKKLLGRNKGYVIYHANIGQSVQVAEALSAAIDARFTRTGKRWTVLQTRAGFPAFEIGVIVVETRKSF